MEVHTKPGTHETRSSIFNLSAREVEESRVEFNNDSSVDIYSNLAKAVFFARKGDRVEVDEKKVFAVFNFSTISPSLGDPFHRITTC